MERHDLQLLEHIIDYCDDIKDALAIVNNTYDSFLTNKMAQYTIAFSILQIGELVGGLSESLRAVSKREIDWPAVKGMRNIIVHHYGEVRLGVVWNVAVNDIPILKEFCERHLSEEF